jgi:hypothetical protein
MAKKELNFGKLSLPEKPVVVKKEEEMQQAEKAVEVIHTPSVVRADSTVETPEKPIEEIKKISLDLPGDIYTYIKMHTFKKRITMREYLLDIIYQDMKKNGGI